MKFISTRKLAIIQSRPITVCLVLMHTVLGAAAEDVPSLGTRLYWDRALLRAGQEETLWLHIEDPTDKQPALEVSVRPPEGVVLLEPATKKIAPSAWAQEPVYVGGRRKRPSVLETRPATRVSWRLRSSEPSQGAVEVLVSGDSISTTLRLPSVFTTRPEITETTYVPVPEPVESERYVGMIYCPLWKPGEHYGWHMMERSMPWRKPALGWYDESLPEVTDWEIKWNVEHGVDFIFYCWYRAFGNEGKPVQQMHSHAIHEGLFNARHQNHIKFCIMWTNTDYSGIASRTDLMENLMPYWMENYFKRSNYLLIDRKPVLAIYDMRRLIKDLGTPEAVRETLDLMRKACTDAGFDGLWILAESRHWWPDYLETMASCGFDASFAYVWNNVPGGASEDVAHDTILSNHQKRIEWNLLPDIPTVSAMWDPSLWEQYAQPDRKSNHYHISPEGFQRVCEDVKALTDELAENTLARRMVFVDNWNEWGEGHYLAPCREHGFEYLDVLRRVFTDAPEPHKDLIPEDVGLGPYDAAYRAWVDTMRNAEPAPAIVLVENGAPAATIVLPEHAEPIAAYAADELAYHIEKASGARLEIVTEPLEQPLNGHAIYIGATRAARDAGMNPAALASEEAVLRTRDGDLYIVGNDGPGGPLSYDNTHSGTLWGVYEVLERWLGVRWLWPGELGEFIPHTQTVGVPQLDESILPRFVTRNQRPGLGRRGFAEGHERMSFSPEHAERYAHDQTVFLRRHRMGRSASSHRAQRRFGSGHSFSGWWERYGEVHPEWFQMLPNGKRGPADPNRPHRVSMCPSSPGLHAKIVELWQEERVKHPGETVNIDLSENDGSARCVCEACLAWDGPPPDPSALPPGLERSYEPVQAGTRYARFAKAVHKLASAIDPEVKVTYYAYLNYFWAPKPPLEMHSNIVIEFVPWFRWAGWFPRTEAEQEWIKEQWMGWQRTGVSAHYRPNWFLDGYTMPLVYMHQFADAFQFYASNGMIGTDFDSLQGQWAAQGPNLYLLSRLHVRPETAVDTLLDEYYAAFGSASDDVKAYFTYWEDYAVRNSLRAADAIRSRSEGHFRRYAKYAQVADELYPPEVFPPAEAALERALKAGKDDSDPVYARRVKFLQQGLAHAKQCAATAGVVNNRKTSMAEKKAAISELAKLRRSLEHTNIANMDRAAIIEADSWEDIPGLFDP